MDVVAQRACYGLELVDALTGGPLIGPNTVVETTGLMASPFRVNASRWVFTSLPRASTAPPSATATFVISTRFYVPQTLTTGAATLPNPTLVGPGPGYLATVTMMPRTGYPFSSTLTRVVGLVQLDPSVNPASPPVPNASVTLTPVHAPPSPPSVDETPVTVTTTDDGQYTYWFLPIITDDPPLANQLTGNVAMGSYSGILPSLSLLANGVTYAPPVFIK
jgi:hypothetical protein